MAARGKPVIPLRTLHDMVSTCRAACEKQGRGTYLGIDAVTSAAAAPKKIMEAAGLLLHGGPSSLNFELGIPDPTPMKSWVRHCINQQLHSATICYDFNRSVMWGILILFITVFEIINFFIRYTQ